MGYYIQAIIGKHETLRQSASQFQHASVVPLAQGHAIIPLIDELYDEIGGGEAVGGFSKLSPGVEEWVQRLSASAPVVYVEAEFFGGIGFRSAVGWSSGSRNLGPFHSQDAINQALRFLGVRQHGANDEFDAVALGRHRDTRDWIEEATQ